MKKVIKAIYHAAPLKREVFSVLKAVRRPGERVYKHLHFKSPFRVKIDSSKSFRIYNNNSQIENEIFWEGLTGRWEKESMKLWIKLSENARSIVDIGANAGVYALVAKAVNPKADVYAFEPHPFFFERLQRNVQLNNFDIHCYQKAVSNFDGDLSIEDYTGENPSIAVQAVSLNSFVKSTNIARIDLMKIDVETFEPEVLEGFSDYLAAHKPTMLIEILNSEVAGKVFNAVKELGYVYFNIDEKGTVRQTQGIETSDYYNYLLCNAEVAKSLGLL